MKDDLYRELMEALDTVLSDLGIPGYVADVDPLEATLLGAYEEDALTVEEALESWVHVGEEDHEA